MVLDHQLWIATGTVLAAVYTAYRLLMSQIEQRVSKDTCTECRTLSKIQDDHLGRRLDQQGGLIESLQVDIKSMDRKLSGVVRALDKICLQIELILKQNGCGIGVRGHRDNDTDIKDD